MTLCVLVALAGAQQATFEEVVRDLSHRDAGVRVAAMRALVQGGHPQAIEPIARLIGDPVDAVQLEAIFSVVSFYAGEQAPTRRRIGGVFEMRGSRGPEAAFLKGPYIVAPLQVPAGVPSALVAALRDDSDRVRADALYAIAIVNPAPAARAVTDPMVPLLGDASPLVRVAAARALGRLRAQGAGDALIQAMNDPDARVRLAATAAASEVRELRAVDAVRQHFEFYGRGRDAVVAFEALSLLGHPSSVPIYRQHLRDSRGEIRGLAAAGLGRARATVALQEIESAMQVETDPVARVGMAFALQRLDRPYAAQLVDALLDEAARMRAFAYLVELGPIALPEVQSALADQRAALRYAAADVLGFIGTATTNAALENRRQDPDPLVAHAAGRAIERIRLRSHGASAR